MNYSLIIFFIFVNDKVFVVSWIGTNIYKTTVSINCKGLRNYQKLEEKKIDKISSTKAVRRFYSTSGLQLNYKQDGE